jgi:hypothetical protein
MYLKNFILSPPIIIIIIKDSYKYGLIWDI